MNLWECEAIGCPARATGTGGGIGLTAIGWYFRKGPVLYCPNHHPGGWQAADNQADAIQDALVLADHMTRAATGHD